MQSSSWQAQLAQAFTSPSQLLGYLGLQNVPDLLSAEAAGDFPFLVTQAYAARMRRGDTADPLLRQVLPVADEMLVMPGFVADPVDDGAAVAAPGLLHKYRGRALLITTGACAIHCRYCFRRAFPYADAQLHKSREQAALSYLAQDASIHEVILSGGDPLLLSDERLASLLDRLAAIPHLSRLRMHSRVPLVLPARVTADLAALLSGTRLQAVLVLHANHAQEMDAEVAAALALLNQRGITLLNQAVLLKGVNDSAVALIDLSESLFRHGVLPYYLHLLDKARGTAHFDVPLPQALVLYEAVRAALPGYLVPRLVREVAGRAAKIPAESLRKIVK
ncbi:MAG: EF-P beta-lysylation protein EpmB [Methylococcaceae bacterium]|nr:MAG: EF-P beta-lysylation protein EpmB [Methylococcaceae bacterium]